LIALGISLDFLVIFILVSLNIFLEKNICSEKPFCVIDKKHETKSPTAEMRSL